MAIAFVAADSKGGDSNSATTDAVNTTGASLLVVGAAFYNPSGAPSITDSKSNASWQQLTTSSSANGIALKIFYHVNPTVGSGHTVTLTGTGANPVPAFAAFSGVVTSSPFDQQNGAAFTSETSAPGGSVTPSENNELIVTCCAVDFQDPTIADGYTTTETGTGPSDFKCTLAYKIQTTLAATNPTWVVIGDGYGTAVRVATFKSAAGGGGGGSSAARRLSLLGVG